MDYIALRLPYRCTVGSLWLKLLSKLQQCTAAGNFCPGGVVGCNLTRCKKFVPKNEKFTKFDNVSELFLKRNVSRPSVRAAQLHV